MVVFEVVVLVVVVVAVVAVVEPAEITVGVIFELLDDVKICFY